ncbi:MAG: DUF3443 domain-containing protein [Burkholderiales bacterium]|nr:DUF3443 domain-containing protein [Burkholderiales bacterium]
MNVRFRRPHTSGFLRVAAFAAILLLASCGGTVGGDKSAAAGDTVIVSIAANPASLTVGQSTTLTWSSSNATACQASGAWSGTVALSGTQLVTPSAAGSYTYTLTCDGVAKSASVVVAASATSLPTVSLSLDPASVPVGQSSTLTWSSTNATSCVASGAWAGSRATSGNISVSQTIAGTYNYSLTCTGAGGSATGAVTLAATDLGDNVALVFLDNGPAGASNLINIPYVSVTVCRPGTSICQTINHVVLDTASSGLRIIAGVLDPVLALPAVTSGGSPVGECGTFVSGYLWGSVRTADVKMAGETASSVSVQQVGDSDAAFRSVPSDCSSIGRNIGTVADLGANGILGVGLFKEDCGAGCAAHPLSATYYKCTASGCTGTAMPLADQVVNPVAAFAANNNGVAVAMPAVPAGGATTLTGALIFGIDTQTNNTISTATVYAADSDGNFTTTYKGKTLSNSFLDTGSNGFFFPDAAIPECFPSTGFYCPSSTLSLSAVNTSTVNGASGTVSFKVENLQALDAAVRAASVGGSFDSTGFDWGMPFFFGRTVFVAIEGASTAHGTGPYWAY